MTVTNNTGSKHMATKTLHWFDRQFSSHATNCTYSPSRKSGVGNYVVQAKSHTSKRGYWVEYDCVTIGRGSLERCKAIAQQHYDDRS